MSATRIIKLFDRYALSLFNVAVLGGLGVVAVGLAAQ